MVGGNEHKAALRHRVDAVVGQILRRVLRSKSKEQGPLVCETADNVTRADWNFDGVTPGNFLENS
jgi:hypothetical protein